VAGSTSFRYQMVCAIYSEIIIPNPYVYAMCYPITHSIYVSFGKVIFGLTLFLSVSGVCDGSVCVRHAES